jgi:hypothetical protein
VLDWVRHHGIQGARAIARHLPAPYVDEAGTPTVPPLLEAIFRDYDDDQLFANFVAGAQSRDAWWGDASEEFRRYADDARRFLNHANPRIREWAKYEIADCQRMAEWEEQRHAERFLPS